MRRCRSPWSWLRGLPLMAAVVWVVPATARAVQEKGEEKPSAEVRLQGPVPFRVYQRDENDRATIPIAFTAETPKGVEVANARVTQQGGQVVPGVKFKDDALVGVPPGGPYTVVVVLKATTNEAAEALQKIINSTGFSPVTITVDPVFVGDLWVLAGQSNMEGVGDLTDVLPPNDKVMLLGSDRKWVQAEEPLHWLVDSPDAVHSGDPGTREERSKNVHKNRRKGAGLGLPFASAMVQATGIPVGLIAAAHGGTSMAQWDPAKKDEAGNSLYGSMMRQFAAAGGKVKGVLWYQGESDALGGAADSYAKTFADFIGSIRSDFGQPDLPFYLVQISRVVRPGEPKGWNAVQEAQRLIPDRVPNTAVVSAIDLELDDGIHIGVQGLKRLGQRLARVAEHELFGFPFGTSPNLDRVSKGPNNTLVVRFKGVNPAVATARGGTGGGMGPTGTRSGRFGSSLQPQRHIAGFSIRKSDGTEIPLIYEAAVGPARDTVVLKLNGPVPEGAELWYGWGTDPYCNLTDALDMAVPVFGPVPLGEGGGTKRE